MRVRGAKGEAGADSAFSQARLRGRAGQRAPPALRRAVRVPASAARCLGRSAARGKEQPKQRRQAHAAVSP